MGSVFKKSSQSTSSTSKSEPWKPSQANLQTTLDDIDSWYNQAQDAGYISSTGDLGSIYNQYLAGLNGISDQSQTGTQQLLGQADTSRNAALAGYTNAADGSMNYSTNDIVSGASSLINNDLLQAQIDAVNNGINRNLTEQAFTGIDRNAVGSGNLGSSRAGIAQAVAARSASEQMADNEATIRSNAYNNALNQSQNVLNTNLNTQLQGTAGQANIANNYNTAAQGYSDTLLNSLAPLLSNAQLNQTITGAQQADQIGQRDYLADLIQQYYLPTNATVGGLGGQTSSSQSSPTGPSTFDKIGSTAGTVAAGMALFSDVRLKKNIEFSHKDNGINYYKWEWNDEGEKLAKDQSTIGVLAQEIMLSHPDAVNKHTSGYYTVDYSKL